jgi:hypothetical protein
MATTFAPDTYDPNAQNTEFDLIEGLINSDPDIARIHKEASEQRWFDTTVGRERYRAAIQQTRWYQENNKYARAAITAFNLAKQGTGADWKTLLENARLQVEAKAAEAGAQLNPQAIKELESRYIYEGWGQDGRDSLLTKALAQYINYQPSLTGGANSSLRGQAGNVAESLRLTAVNNGLNYNDDFYQSAARSVAMGMSTVDDWSRDIRENAASLWPVFGQQIRAGVDARQMASPYIQAMAQEFEINPQEITLSDPYIRSALGGFSNDGQPQATNLWEFQKKLRQDPRWMNTAKAQNEVTSVTGKVMQMFGLMGG